MDVCAGSVHPTPSGRSRCESPGVFVYDPTECGWHRSGLIKIEFALTPTFQLWEAQILNILGYIPHVRELATLDLVQKVSQRNCGTSARFNLLPSMKTEITEAGVNLTLRPHARMKRGCSTCLLEQRPSLFPNLHPSLAGVAIAPFVKENAALPQNFLCLPQQALPVRNKIQKSRQHDGIDAVSSKWETCAFGRHRQDQRLARLSLHSLQHGERGVDCDYMKTLACERDSDAARTGSDVDNRCISRQAICKSLGQFIRNEGTMAVIVDSRIGGEIGALGH